MQHKYLGFLEEYKKDHLSFATGCTNDEIDQIEKSWNVKLPLCYRELFLIFGKYGAFAFDLGNTFQYEEFHEMQQEAIMIAEDYDLDFMNKEKDNFVFSCFGLHGKFWFFKLDEGDDPPVYEFKSGNDKYIKIKDHFSDYVKSLDIYREYV
ncbi:SMI1 / KNR4 family (SUKH-1) [Chitinophaga sp. CF118]|uniref:SMI1/KNR4 family protein n=1 Tax=Chitinophaga sp. CF118 TaxID=1884367 RepID=UPI0008E8E84A|nr:SMI1/KNR4 family protein [Chitinophaga sp. CF118]SFD54530.1 SMI1 / KNR4 family (SUKH-1) [Chitinophaga sp. CF118]